MSEEQRIQAQLKEAIELAQAGNRTAARQLLEDIIAVDPQQELAWLWLATVSTDRQERVRFLSEVLTLNPGNARAQEAYAQLTGEAFVPPESPPDGPVVRAGEGPSLSLPLIAGIIAVGVFGVIVVLLALNSGGTADSTPTPFPTRIRTATPTRGPSPTPTYTPFPTNTRGPSPTPINWEALPTWTPVQASTDAPTRTSLPSSTPLASRTPQPTRTPFATATDVPSTSSDMLSTTETPADAAALTVTITPFPAATGDSAADENSGS